MLGQPCSSAIGELRSYNVTSGGHTKLTVLGRWTRLYLAIHGRVQIVNMIRLCKQARGGFPTPHRVWRSTTS